MKIDSKTDRSVEVQQKKGKRKTQSEPLKWDGRDGKQQENKNKESLQKLSEAERKKSKKKKDTPHH